MLLRPLPYQDPARLVVTLRGPTANGPVPPADYFDYRRDARSFERLCAAQAWAATLAGGERPERIAGLKVSADLFDLLGVPAIVGRTFARGEDEPGRDKIVVLGHGLWQRRFGGDRSIVGRTAQLDGQPYEVVGVMRPRFASRRSGRRARRCGCPSTCHLGSTTVEAALCGCSVA